MILDRVAAARSSRRDGTESEDASERRSPFTSESVTEGHPDKMCDQISDAVLDAIFEQDPKSRVACETLCTTGLVVVAGEISTQAYVDFQRVVRDTVRGIGYDRAAPTASTANTCAVITSIDEQSPDIAQGVDKAKEHRDGVDRPLRRGRRRRPGDDVRLRLRRDRRPHADADLARAPARPSALRGPQGRARSTTCGPTARPR